MIDFKSNKYNSMLCGYIYETDEENPMIGWRGASRYYSLEYKECFELECLAIKKVREEHSFNIVIVMLPFVRTPD
jgi:pyruvate,water dikinase